MLDMGNLRSALHATPSEQAWEHLCDLLDQIASKEDAEHAINYILPHLRHHWPSNLRTLPAHWLAALLPERESFANIYNSPEEDERTANPLIPLFLPLIASFSSPIELPVIRSRDLSALFERYPLTALEHLDIAGQYLTDAEIDALAGVISQTDNLHHLDARGVFATHSYHPRSEVRERLLSGIEPRQRGQLRSVSLGLNNIDTLEIETLLSRPNLRGLTHLSLAYNRLDDRFIELLLAAPLAQELKHLDISYNRITTDALEVLAHEDALPALRTLAAFDGPTEHDIKARLEARGVILACQLLAPCIEATIWEKGGGQARVVLDKPRNIIGRIQSNDIVLPKGNVSKRHLAITRLGRRIFIEDWGSAGGTYVNGRKICGPSLVSPSDKIYVGDFIIQLRAVDSSSGREEPGA